MMMLDQVEDAAHLLRTARSVVALTGAGFSTPSGIPDFRGDGGLWSQDDPMEVASLSGFRRDPSRFYRWFWPLLEQLVAAQPNPAHRALAALERARKLRAVITQNIDGLHQRGGSREVYEIHGHVRSATCIECERQVPSEPLLASVRKGKTPRCSCGGTFKPDVVLFEEDLPRGLYWLSTHALEQSDVVIVAGASLEVYPAAYLPLAALNRGARLVIINKSETHLDDRADIVLRGDVAVALPEIVERLEIRD